MNSDPHTIPLLPVGTLVAWVLCTGIGVLGLVMAYAQVQPPASPEIPPTQIVDAQLAPEALPERPAAVSAPPPEAVVPMEAAPAPAPLPPPVPSAPAMVAVAPASPAISFAVPVAGLTRVVEMSDAGFNRAAAQAPASAAGGTGGTAGATPPAPPKTAPVPSVVHLSIGEGEGSAIHPEYPRDAILAQEEGTVGVRFTVGEDGRVISAEITLPSRWPLLNQAATRAVKEAVFPPGPRRIFDVPIEFELNR